MVFLHESRMSNPTLPAAKDACRDVWLKLRAIDGLHSVLADKLWHETITALQGKPDDFAAEGYRRGGKRTHGERCSDCGSL
jgi:hypothetical protein